jgi:hypothetical protein
MVLLMGSAFIAGAVLTLIVRYQLRNLKIKRQRIQFVTLLFPPAVMAYLLCFVIACSILSSVTGTPDLLFGDIDEPLPNGFKLEALSKMPEDGLIKREGDPLAQIGWVSALQTSGPFVLGKYDYTDFPKTADQSSRNFFLLDTSTGRKQDFGTESDLSNALNGPIHLTPTEFFHAPKPPGRRLRDFSLFLIAFMPPTAAGLWLLWRLRNLIRTAKTNSEP